MFQIKSKSPDKWRIWQKFEKPQGIEKQFMALSKGFTELVMQDFLAPFDERELELIIGGLGKIDTEDWKTNTRLKVRNTYLSILLKSIQWWWRKNYDLDTFRAHLRTRGEQWKIDTEDWRTNTRLKVRKSRGREGKEKQWKIDTEELI